MFCWQQSHSIIEVVLVNRARLGAAFGQHAQEVLVSQQEGVEVMEKVITLHHELGKLDQAEPEERHEVLNIMDAWWFGLDAELRQLAVAADRARADSFKGTLKDQVLNLAAGAWRAG